MSEGLNFLVRCLEEGSLEQFRRMPSEAFEVDEDEEEAHSYIIRHLRRHGRLPTVETLDEQVSFELPETPEPISYYRERLTTRSKYNGLREPFNSLRSAMGDADMDSAEEAVTQMVQTLRRTDDRSQILSTEQWGDQVISAYNEAHMIDGLIGVPTPWDIMNQDTGGWMGGDLNMFVARPEIGKTWAILCCLLSAAMSGRRVFFATTEMSPKAIGNRFYSMLAGVDHRLVRRGMLSTHAQQRLVRAKEFVDEVMNISIFGSEMGGNTLSLTAAVQDHAPDIVFIDGVYLMRPAAPPKNGQKNDIVASVLDDLKSLALQADIPIVGTSQFNRISGKAGRQGSLETIGFTDAFSTHCSVIYKVGLPGAGAQDTQTRILEVMKGREGESIPVPINFKFTPYNFGQTTMDMVAGRDGAEPPPEQNLDWME